ncbi:unnamed protein product, partial [Didymodactylos carnosus]
FINNFYVGQDNFSVQADIKLDGIYLQETLLDLGFKVQIYEDLTAVQIVTCLEDALTTDHSNSDCLVIILLSCGNDKELVYASDHAMSIGFLTSQFKLASTTLSGKPKIFILPILRSQHLTELMNKQIAFVDDNETPIVDDFLMVYSTLRGE